MLAFVYMDIKNRTNWIIGAAIVLVVGVAVYFAIKLSPPSAPPFNFTATSTPSVNGPAGSPSGTKPSSSSTVVKKSLGYTIQVHGTTETIISNGAGVTIEVPVNTTVSQTNAVLSVTPPQSGNGESLKLQKTVAAFSDPLARVASLMNGTANGFNALRTANDNTEFNPGSVVSAAHVVKLRNLTVDGVAAVQVHITETALGSTPARDFYLTWVHSGITNWYIVRTSAGLTPAAASALDTAFSSIHLLR